MTLYEQDLVKRYERLRRWRRLPGALSEREKTSLIRAMLWEAWEDCVNEGLLDRIEKVPA